MAAKKEIKELAERKNPVLNASTAIDEPWFLARYFILQAIKAFMAAYGRKPKFIYVPQAVEAVLQVDFGRNLDQHEKLRKEGLLFDIPVVWDAVDFRLE